MSRESTYDAIRAALQAQYDVLITAFADLDPGGPTDCRGWTVADLETHVAQTARSLTRIAAEGLGKDGGRAGAHRPPTGGLDAWARQLPALAGEFDQLARGERLPLAPQARAVTEALREPPGDTVVHQLTGTHTLKDASLFRLVEGVVHGLDVAVAPDPQALKVVVRELARALADRHPGRTVEVRVPPYTAVQCLPGPPHTRGTPSNVVEVEPVAFVRLCAGRERWADAVREGRVRASGERSDLSALLPLLR